MIGPGKYDDLCTFVRLHADAVGAIVVVIDGKLGSGFSAQLPEAQPPQVIAAILRDMAEQLDRDVQ